MTLMGAEDVRAAGNRMCEAASSMQSAASSIDFALTQFVQRFIEQVDRIEAAMRRGEDQVVTGRDTESAFEGWAVLELMGHRRIGGRVREQEIAGTKMLRVDIPGDGPEDYATQFYGGSAIYCLTPTTEEMARAAAKASRPEPVTRWELPKPAEKSRAERGLCDGYDQSCVLAIGHKGECVDELADIEKCDGCGRQDTTVLFRTLADATLCEDCAKPDDTQASVPAPVSHDASTCGGSGECGRCAAADEGPARCRGSSPDGCTLDAPHSGACVPPAPAPADPAPDVEAARRRVKDCTKCLHPAAFEGHTCQPGDVDLVRESDAKAKATEPTVCSKCDGERQVADTDDEEPWSAWASLPQGSDAAVRMGLVKPKPCPKCCSAAPPDLRCPRSESCIKGAGHDGRCDEIEF